MTQATVGSARYARVTPRLEAFIRDLIVQGTILVGFFTAGSLAGEKNTLQILVPVGLLTFLSYEPVLITLRGATIGQRAMNLRVVRASDFGGVSFPRALLRTFVKMVLGFSAFAAVYFTARHQALHDLAAGTVVIPYDATIARPGWFDPQRREEPTYVLPHPLRRLVVVLAYWLVLAMAFPTLVPLLLPNCFPSDHAPRCSASEALFGRLVAVAILFAFVGVAVAGALGLLWGARRRDHQLDLGTVRTGENR